MLAGKQRLSPHHNILRRPITSVRSDTNYENHRHSRKPTDCPQHDAKTCGIRSEGAADVGAETEMIDLCDYRITPCTACEGCSFNGICIYDDDVPAIVERMKEADGIIFASPVYIDNISGQMKVFFDRLADAIHYQVLAGKFGCSVATTHTSGGEEVVAYQNHVLNYLGVIAVGGLVSQRAETQNLLMPWEVLHGQPGRNWLKQSRMAFPIQNRKKKLPATGNFSGIL